MPCVRYYREESVRENLSQHPRGISVVAEMMKLNPVIVCCPPAPNLWSLCENIKYATEKYNTVNIKNIYISED